MRDKAFTNIKLGIMNFYKLALQLANEKGKNYLDFIKADENNITALYMADANWFYVVKQDDKGQKYSYAIGYSIYSVNSSTFGDLAHLKKYFKPAFFRFFCSLNGGFDLYFYNHQTNDFDLFIDNFNEIDKAIEAAEKIKGRYDSIFIDSLNN